MVTDQAAKVVVQTWSVLPDQEQLLTDLLHHLATIALATWPFWYGQSEALDGAFLLATPVTLTQLLPQQRPRQPISTLWLKQAAHACTIHQPPLFPDLTRGQQLAQLALAIDPGNLTLILALTDPQPQPYRLLGLARTAVWLATTTAARVAILAPVGLITHPELESILYGAVTVPDRLPPPALVDESAKATIWPIQGRPHPFSPGEQRLAALLAQDTELAALFQYNERIDTFCQSHYWVDLLWRAGRLVIEIDGYRVHSSRTAFHQDRQRDYELLLSGYQVLRLPHDEVMAETAHVLEKIRNVVRHCQRQMATTTGNEIGNDK